MVETDRVVTPLAVVVGVSQVARWLSVTVATTVTPAMRQVTEPWSPTPVMVTLVPPALLGASSLPRSLRRRPKFPSRVSSVAVWGRPRFFFFF